MSEEDEKDKPKSYFGMALDPIHVGTGGYRLGRVDNTIIREPGTNLPKIPGSTIEGCARTYAYYKEKGSNSNINNACALGKKLNDENPCGTCPICKTFGFSKDDNSLHGMAQFSDARILLFPVHSMIGPVWVTSHGILEEFEIEENVGENTIKTTFSVSNGKLNLGWLYIEREDSFSLPNDNLQKIPEEIKNRLVLVSDKLFGQIVNSNLEVRTSVSIDPTTGAAQEGALFTYEAIPRATVLWFDVVFNNPEHFGIDNSINMEKIKNTVGAGFELFETLGIGGMQTRGFGRFRFFNLEGDSGGE